MSDRPDKSLLKPGALPPVPVTCDADRFDNMVREFGIGYCCEWFGHDFDGEFAVFTIEELKARNKQAHGGAA